VPGEGAATPLTLPNMQLPDGTVSTAPKVIATGAAGQFKVNQYDACAPNNTTQLIVNTGKGPKPFINLLPIYGWGPAAGFPQDGQVLQRCGADPCFIYVDGNFLTLPVVTDYGHGVISFKLLVTSGLGAPACAAGTFGSANYVATLDDVAGVTIPLPPLTKLGMGNGAAGSTYIPACSAGTTANLTAFFNAAMPAWGWSPDASVGAGGWMQSSGGRLYAVETQNLSSPTNWTLRIFRPQ
jgi:hypothetical protein